MFSKRINLNFFRCFVFNTGVDKEFWCYEFMVGSSDAFASFVS